MKIQSFFLLLTMLVIDSCYSQSPHDRIVLIGVGDYDKGRIAKIISKINDLNPKVISVDITFSEYNGDTNDKNLYLALRNVKRLVLPSKIVSEGQDYQGNKVISVYLTCAADFFVPYAKAGFVSAKVERDQTQIPTQFIVWQKGSYSDDIYHHFSVATVMSFDSLKALHFVRNHKRHVEVDYDGGKRKFKIFSPADVLGGKLTRSDIEGKIVMIGFLGPGEQDKFSTPFNTNPNEPDLYGLQYLANIVAQVLEYNNE